MFALGVSAPESIIMDCVAHTLPCCWYPWSRAGWLLQVLSWWAELCMLCMLRGAGAAAEPGVHGQLGRGKQRGRGP